MKRILSAIFLAAALSAWATEPGFDPKAASLDDLFFHVQRYGTTPEKKENKRLARDELKARGPEALAFYLDNAAVENSMYGILANETAWQLDADTAVPVLLRALESSEPKTRETAVFFLGNCDRPEYAARVVPFLNNEEQAGAAIRTLGRWQFHDAVPLIVGFLQNPKERRRIAAVNALRHISDPSAIPALIAALGDSVFTVRKAAARALTALGQEAEKPVLKAFPISQRTPQREMIGVLGGIGSKTSVRFIRRLLVHPDPAIREDAARALGVETLAAAQPSMRVEPGGMQVGVPAQKPAAPDNSPLITATAEVVLRPSSFYTNASVEVQQALPAIRGTLEQSLLPGAGISVRLIKVTPGVTKKLLAVRQSFARIRQKLLEDIQPIRLEMPTVTGPPGYNRSPWIERSQADIARARTAAQGEAVRRLNAFAEDCRLTTVKAATDGAFAFTRLSPGLYYVYAQASIRSTDERNRLQHKPAIWWASVQLTDGAAVIAFNENNALEWTALFPE